MNRRDNRYSPFSKIIEPFIEQLYDNDEEKQDAAVIALLRLGDGRAIAPLIQLLHTDRKRIRNVVLTVLTQLSNPNNNNSAVEPVIELLRDEDEEVRSVAVKMLRNMKDPRAADALVAAFDREKGERRLAIVRALVCIGDQRVGELYVKVLQNEKDVAPFQIIRELGKLRDPKTVGALLELFLNVNDLLRLEIVEVLGQIGDNGAVEMLLNALNDVDFVQFAAIDALGQIGDTRAVEPLIQLLQHHHPQIRYRAARALGSMRDVRTVEPLIEAIHKDEANEHFFSVANAVRAYGYTSNTIRSVALTGISQLTPSNLSEVVTPYLDALANIQRIILQLYGEEFPQLEIFQLSARRIDLRGVVEAVDFALDFIRPARRKLAKSWQETAVDVSARLLMQKYPDLEASARDSAIQQMNESVQILLESPIEISLVFPSLD